jgi:hypothetical protein
LWLIWARLEVAWSSTSEICSKVWPLRLVDSRDLVFVGWTLEDVVSLGVPWLYYEDFFLKALRGTTEQLATAMHGISQKGLGGVRGRTFLCKSQKKTRFIFLLCFTRFLYALYLFMVYWPVISFTFLSTSDMKSSALWPSVKWSPNRGKGTSCAA